MYMSISFVRIRFNNSKKICKFFLDHLLNVSLRKSYRKSLQNPRFFFTIVPNRSNLKKFDSTSKFVKKLKIQTFNATSKSVSPIETDFRLEKT